MSLLSPAEALAFNGFLSSVDYANVLDSEWSALTSQLAPPRGREALAKATKDLMSLEPQPQASGSTSSRNSPMGSRSDPPSPSSPSSPRSASPSSSSVDRSTNMQVVTATAAASVSTTVNGWPNFTSPTEQNDPHHHQPRHKYTYGFGVPSHLRTESPSSTQRLSGLFINPFDSSGQSNGHPPSSLPLPYPHAHSESALRHRAGSLHSQLSPLSASYDDHGFMLPPLPDHAQLQQMHAQSPTSYSSSSDSLQHGPSQHPGITSSTSAPPVLVQRTSSTKRSHPIDDGDSDTSSNTTTTKRQRRPSTTPSLDAPTPEPQNGSSSSAQRQALLSPSQKRANHIQSEQKRRANIRRGYEALCDVVPTLREAIKTEEESLAAAEEEKANSKSRSGGRKKGKGKPKEECGPGGGSDGRAGPRSENVVLQQTIDYVQGLLSERDNLLQRLVFARSTLTTQNPTHPSLRVSPSSSSPDGVVLWEREWGGGTGWGAEEGEEE